MAETYYQYPENELFLRNHSIPYFVFDTEVYFFLTSANFNKEMLHKVLHSARDYPFISYLTSSLVQLSFLANKEMIENLGKHTQFTLVGAFDAEGYYLILKIEEIQIEGTSIPQQALPLFNLTNASNSVGGNEAEWNKRNIVRCAGTDQGNVLFANILLNFGRPQETCVEAALEDAVGYGGVGPGSAEVKLWLPDNPDKSE